MKKITMQDIANAAGVSRVTVSKVLNNNDGVSEELKEKVIKVAIDLGYTKLNLESEEVSEIKNIAIAISRPESSAFWMNIIHFIAKYFAEENVNIIYTYLPSSYKPSFSFPQSFYDRTIDGLIVMNVYDRKMYDFLQTLSLPKVFLDTPDRYCLGDVTGDVVYIAGRSATKKICFNLIEKGHSRIGFIGDVDYASTNRDRYDGFLDAMNECGLPIDDSICHTDKIEISAYKEEIESFLARLIDRGAMPTAFVCVSDFVAHFVMDYCEKNGYVMHENIEITGFDGNREYMKRDGDEITTAIVDLKAIGYKLARQIDFRLKYIDYPYEVCYISSEVELR